MHGVSFVRKLHDPFHVSLLLLRDADPTIQEDPNHRWSSFIMFFTITPAHVFEPICLLFLVMFDNLLGHVSTI